MRRFCSSIVWLTLGLGVLLGGCSASVGLDAASPDTATAQLPQPVSTPVVREDLAQMLPISAEAEIDGQVIELEVARTPMEQAKGLMYRPVLPDNRGMMFPFEPPRPVQFWMMNTPQPLDMVFLLNGEVKAVEANVPPCTRQPCPTYGTQVAVNQVIELRAGRAAELGIEPGKQLNIRFLDQPKPTP